MHIKCKSLRSSDEEGDGADFLLTDDGGDIDLRLERLEWLLAQRPVLLSSVMLRQNPHNVQVRIDQLCAQRTNISCVAAAC